MDKRSPEILALRKDIEHEVGCPIRTPYDFEFLAGVVWERLHENISPTTLKRLWGYIDGAEMPRYATLSILCRVLGYRSWDEYLERLLLVMAWRVRCLPAKVFVSKNYSRAIE